MIRQGNSLNENNTCQMNDCSLLSVPRLRRDNPASLEVQSHHDDQ